MQSQQSLAVNENARRSRNKENALLLAEAGFAVFPSDGKVPLVKAYNRLDIDIPLAERKEIEQQVEADTGAKPVHVGCTRSKQAVLKIWRTHKDAVPSIACGPSGLVVLDADVKNNGPALLAEFVAEHGGYPEGTVLAPTKSGGVHAYFADPNRERTNRAGGLKKLGTDVRGSGGQTVAPGSIREDGRTYGTQDDLKNLVRAYKLGKLPPLPAFVVEKIGQSSEVDDSNVTHLKEREVIARLRDEEWPDHEALFGDVALGAAYDLDGLKAKDEQFAKLLENPTSDCSANRFEVAHSLLREWPQMAPAELAVFLEAWDGSGALVGGKPGEGEYDLRQIAREWLKNQGLKPITDGSAFGIVDEDDEREGSQSNRLSKRFEYIENIRGATLRLLDWCIKFFIARGTTSMVTGLWGAGKTAVFSDIGLHVGHGFEWRGRKVKKGVVIYVALENSEDVERRVATWCELMERAGRDVTGGAFVVHRGPCCLFDPNGRPTRDERDLIAIAKQAAAHYDLPVAMIVLDTLAQSLAPGDDNSAKDAGIYTAALQRIAAATGANVTALAHPTKAGDGIRGSGALQANVDTVITLSRDASGRGKIEAGSKFRIGNPVKVRFGYRLQSHVIGQDEDGDDIDVVLAVEPPVIVLGPAEDDDEQVACLVPRDSPEDRLNATLVALRDCAERIAESTGEEVSAISIPAGEIWERMNQSRKEAGLPELKDRTVVPYMLRKLIERGDAAREGRNKRLVRYRLAGKGFSEALLPNGDEGRPFVHGQLVRID